MRHGQTAGFLTGAYRDLTPLGVEQAAAFGRWCAAAGVRPDRVVVGPRERHEQTWHHACQAAGGGWPAPERDEGLDEHHGFAVVAEAIRGGCGAVGERMRAAGQSGDPAWVLRAFRGLMEAWAAGEVRAPDDDEDWAAFSARVRGTVASLCAPDERRTTLAFTSGGFVGVGTAWAAGVRDPGREVDFAFAVENTAFAELRYSTTRARPPTLYRFNTTPHLGSELPSTGI